MEDLFEVVVIIIAAVIGVIAKNGKKKKKAAGKPKAHAPLREAGKEVPASKPNPAARKSIEDAIAAFAENFEELEEKLDNGLPKFGRPAPAAALPPLPDGADEHGCIGGSLMEHKPEGESRTEHAAHEANRKARLAEERAARPAAAPKISAQDLRRAVIMSEILDKPVSLRRRAGR